MFCPIIKDECVKEKCAWWIKLMQKNPQTEELKEISSCSIPLMVDVGIDNGKGIMRVQSAVESERNVTNSARMILLNLLKNSNDRLIGG